jgi:hypothetical protein
LAGFTALDWIGAATIVLLALAVMAVPFVVAPPIVSMYEEFEAALPTITRLVITGWFAPLLAQLPLALLVVALIRRHKLSAARPLVALAFVLALACGALCWYGLYAPIFELAGAIADEPLTATDPAPTRRDPPIRQPAPARLVAIGDLHGDLAATRRALRLAGAIDDQDRWIGGDLVVVQNGDTIDRGDYDRAVLDLLDRLKSEAQAAGGALICLNGNHEVMNVAGDLRYVTPKSVADFADFPPAKQLDHVRPPDFPAQLGGRVTAFGPGNEYALRFATQNVVVVIGDTVFVHGAITAPHVAYGLDRINREVRDWMRGDRPALPAIVEGPESPYWIRRFSDEPVESDCPELERALAAIPAKRMVVGHERQGNGVTSACNGKVWRIDTEMSAFYGGPTEVLEIRGDKLRVLGR